MPAPAPTPSLPPVDPPWEIIEPPQPRVPVVFASPHSGDVYPPAFVAAARLDPVALRRSEDAYVDRIFGAAPLCGAPMIKARYPRAYVDPNREPWELDPAMFDGPLPSYVNTDSPRVAAGLGTVAKVVTSGETIYAGKLSFDEVRGRIDSLYTPYHDALKGLIARSVERFGVCLLIDCHSMPSIGGPMDADPGDPRVDAVLGDRFGTSCHPAVTQIAETACREQGLNVRRNRPYAGGFTTSHYGKPSIGVHALQIEVNRALYMEETTLAPRPGLAKLTEQIARVIERLTAIDPRLLAP